MLKACRKWSVLSIVFLLLGVFGTSTALVPHLSPLTSNSSPLPSNPAPQEDSLRARWRIQKTAPIEVADLDSSAIDLKRPENIRQTVEYDDSANVYYVGSKIGDSYLNVPILMTPK